MSPGAPCAQGLLRLICIIRPHLKSPFTLKGGEIFQVRTALAGTLLCLFSMLTSNTMKIIFQMFIYCQNPIKTNLELFHWCNAT